MFELSQEGVDFVKQELQRYETRLSAVIPCLYRVQKEHGWVPEEAVPYLAQLMDLPEAKIEEVRQFYTLFNKKPVGKYHAQVCCNVSCSLNGGRELAQRIAREFQVKEGEVSADGKITVTRVECLGSCGTAPMMQVNDEYWENLTPETAVQRLKELD